MKQNSFLNNRKQKGFTMVEALTVVAILCILFGIGVANLLKMQRSLRQRELDSKAEIIYVAAQNRLSELRAAGYDALYTPTDTDGKGVVLLQSIPSDAQYDADDDERPVLYSAYSDDKGTAGKAAASILPETVVDRALWGNHWIIEYSPVSGSVYGVFYSERSLDTLKDNEISRNLMRYKENRLSGGAYIGYYGGDVTLVNYSKKLHPSIEIVNAETLTATFRCNDPVGSGLCFTIEIKDMTTGETYTRTVRRSEMQQISSTDLRYVWVLDKLEKGGHFQDQTGMAGGNYIEVSMQAYNENDQTMRASAEPRYTNGLFGDPYLNQSYSANRPDTDTAYIQYVRHLQNLDKATSGVTDTIRNAVIVKDLSLRDDPADSQDYYSVYNTDTFKPIENENLMTITGRYTERSGSVSQSKIDGMHVAASYRYTGLFAQFYGTSISSVRMSGLKIDGGITVGGLVGQIAGTSPVTIDDCWVYLDDVKGDLVNLPKAASAQTVTPWISGNVVGGLVGTILTNARVTVKNSMASSAMRASRYVGGLVGTVQGRLAVEDSYADSYLIGENATGGIVGGSTPAAVISLAHFYVAGFQSATTAMAGVTPFYATQVEDGYVAVEYTRQGSNTQLYTTVSNQQACTMKNVYYLQASFTDAVSLDGTFPFGSDALKQGTLLKNLSSMHFKAFAPATTAYNMMEGMGLTSYIYPALNSMAHYGDWVTVSDSETLVYFERYPEGSVAFSGSVGSNLRSSNVTQDNFGSNYARYDGYAIAFTPNQPALSWTKRVTFENGNSYTITVEEDSGGNRYARYQQVGSDSSTVEEIYHSTLGGVDYYLVALPREEMTNGDAEGFYQTLILSDVTQAGTAVTDETFYFNPCFAKTVIQAEHKPSTAPQTISVRTPRHLYALAELYGSDGFVQATAKSTFYQELDLNYAAFQWKLYDPWNGTPSQLSVGSGDTPFRAVYNGGCHAISHMDVQSDTMELGLFGQIGTDGTVQNLFLTGTGEADVYNTVRRTSGDSYTGSANSPRIGALAGVNDGTIRNCAVTGYALQPRGFRNSVITVGGLVGLNRGYIAQCGSDVPKLTVVSNNAASAYAGGFVGRNEGTIASSYSVGILQVLSGLGAQRTVLSGFAGANNATLDNCYAAVALFPRDGAESYGFCPKGGSNVNECYYLDGVTLQYGDTLCLLNASQNSDAAKGDGLAISYEALTARGSSSTFSPLHPETEGTNYLFPVECYLPGGLSLHVGNWLYAKSLGTLGVFYWEFEATGSNIGYHFSYIGTTEGKPFQNSNLCTAHGDDGAVTRYGYGYFYTGSTAPTLSADTWNIHFGTPKDDVAQELSQQMPGYSFVAYETGGHDGSSWSESYMHLAGSDTNAEWTLTYNGFEYTYTVSPFFANAFSLDEYLRVKYVVDNEVIYEQVTTGNPKPGASGNEYEIRSIAQLQFINWNYGTMSTTHSITQKTPYYGGNNNKFPYLTWGNKENTPGAGLDAYWKQGHDLDAFLEGVTDYTPIGSMYDKAGNDRDADAEMAFFGSSFDGQAYTIKNLEIRSAAQCVGLFGITAGAKLTDIVMYSNRGNTIEATNQGNSWYCLGGIVGLAGSRDMKDSEFRNCTVSGYKLLDSRGKGRSDYNPGWGGGCVGGLVGATTMNIINCSAVTDITIDMGYTGGYQNNRVGGIVGSIRGALYNCYAGGSIRSISNVPHGDWYSNSNIWVGGLVGGIIMRYEGNLSALIGKTGVVTTVTNCYSYVELPEKGSNAVKSSQSIASNGEMQENFANVSNDYIIIYNSYCLESSVTKTDDYKDRWAYNGNYSNANLNRTNTSRNDRRIEIQNKHVPYLTYEQMMDGTLQGYLSERDVVDGIRDFSTVTVWENGDPVDGKYSFPGSDTELTNLNYPFPTILTQENVYGQTVNVHYGSWPKFGIFWDQNQDTIDILADWVTDAAANRMLNGEAVESLNAEAEAEAVEPLNAEAEAEAVESMSAETEAEAQTQPEDGAAARAAQPGAALSQRILNVYSLTGFDAGNTPVDFTYQQDDGTEMAEKDAAAIVKDCTASGGNYKVTIQAQKPGTSVIKAVVSHGGKDYEAYLTVTVTAQLQLKVGDGTALTLYEGDSLEVPVTISENPYVGMDSEDITLSVSVVTQEALPPVDTALKKLDDGTNVVQIDGLNSGRATVTVQASFTPDWSSTPIQANGSANVEVWPSIVLGISDGTDYAGASVKHTILNGRSTDSAALTQGPKPEGQELFLYTTRDTHAQTDYATLDTLPLQSAVLTVDGQACPLEPISNAGGSLVYGFSGQDGREYRLTLGPVSETSDCHWRSAAVTDGEGQPLSQQWSLKLAFQRQEGEGKNTKAETFTLSFQRVNLLRFYSGESEQDPGELLETVRVAQGQKPELQQDALDAELAKKLTDQPGQGYHWSWPLPTETITGSQDIYRQKKANSYLVHFDGNFTGWDVGGMTMADIPLTYDQETVTAVPASEYTREGSSFLGWALDKNAAAPDFTAGAATDLNAQLKAYRDADGKALPLNNGSELTLYAIWRENKLTLTLYPGDGSDTEPQVQEFTYSKVQAGEAVPDVPTAQWKGHAFSGWAATAAGAQVYAKTDSIPADLRSADQSMTLYGVWTTNSARVEIRNANDAGQSQTFIGHYTEGESIGFELPELTRVGYTLLGFAETETGPAAYQPGNTISFAEKDLEQSSIELELWALWRENTLTLELYPNLEPDTQDEEIVPEDQPETESTVETEESEGDQEAQEEEPAEQELPEALALEQPTEMEFTYTQVLGEKAVPDPPTDRKPGYTFAGWSEEPDGTLEFPADEPLPVPEDMETGDYTWKLYAVWEENTGALILRNQDGAGDEATFFTCTYTDETHGAELPEPELEGFDFLGWAREEDGQPEYAAGQTVDLGSLEKENKRIELWAVWSVKADAEAEDGESTVTESAQPAEAGTEPQAPEQADSQDNAGTEPEAAEQGFPQDTSEAEPEASEQDGSQDDPETGPDPQ